MLTAVYSEMQSLICSERQTGMKQFYGTRNVNMGTNKCARLSLTLL